MALLDFSIGWLWAAKNAAPDAPSNSLFWIWTIGIPLLLYFVVLRPGQQQERKRRELLGAIKKNDKVVTSSGIFGTIVSVDNDRVVLRVDDDRGVKLTLRKAVITEVVDSASDKSAESKSAESGAA
jgi:preprotein translocase subunit YajC